MPDFSKRQTQIIESAIELIARGGIQELTIKNIATEIGISEPAIYRHFGSKQEILVAIQNFFSAEKNRAFSKVLGNEKAALDKITQIMEYHFSSFSAKPALAAVLFSEEIFQNDRLLADMVLEIMKQSHAAITRIIEQGQIRSNIRSDIPAKDLATIIMGSLRLTVKTWQLNKCSYDLIEAGQSFLQSIRKIMEPNFQ